MKEFRDISKEMYVPSFMRVELPENAVNPICGFFGLPAFLDAYKALLQMGDVDVHDFFNYAWDVYWMHKERTHDSMYVPKHRAHRDHPDNDDKCDIVFRMMSYFGLGPDVYNLYSTSSSLADMLQSNLTLGQTYKTIKDYIDNRTITAETELVPAKQHLTSTTEDYIDEGIVGKKELDRARKQLIFYTLKFRKRKEEIFEKFNKKIGDLHDPQMEKILRALLHTVSQYYYGQVDDSLPPEIKKMVGHIEAGHYDAAKDINVSEVGRTDDYLEQVFMGGNMLYVPYVDPKPEDVVENVTDAEIIEEENF